MHGLFDGCVSAADLKKATFQRVLTDDDGEKNAHLIVSALHPHRNTQAQGGAKGQTLKKGNVIQFALCADLTAFTWHSAAPLMLAEFQDIQATQRSLLPGTPAEGLHKSEEIYLKHF